MQKTEILIVPNDLAPSSTNKDDLVSYIVLDHIKLYKLANLTIRMLRKKSLKMVKIWNPNSSQ